MQIRPTCTAAYIHYRLRSLLAAKNIYTPSPPARINASSRDRSASGLSFSVFFAFQNSSLFGALVPIKGLSVTGLATETEAVSHELRQEQGGVRTFHQPPLSARGRLRYGERGYTGMNTLSPSPFLPYSLSDDDLRELLRRMLLHRQIDTRGFQLNRQGRIPFALGGEGHEAIQAGASLAFRRGSDILVPYYRDIGLALGIGFPMIDAFTALFAKRTDRCGGRQFPSHFSHREIGLVSVSSIITGHCSHAVGIAFAMAHRRQQDPAAVLCSFGDGATSQGEWHESLNFAGIHRLPIVFLCQNNGWAISVPLERQMPIANVADRAAGYGMPGVIVDGFDVVAVYEAVGEALNRARNGGGPTLIEAKCYRFLSHTTDDDDRTYRSRAEVEAQRLRDPIPRFERELIARRLLTAEHIDAMKAALWEEIDATLEEAAGMPPPEAADLVRNVYEGSHEPWI